MKIHEYQGKELLKKFGVTVPRGVFCQSVDEAVKAAETLGGKVWVVKAQIHAGGRGKGGGVKVAKSLDEVRQYAGQILGMQLVTHQTGPEGQKVRRLLIEEGADIKQGILRRRADRPRYAEGGHDGLVRRRHGHRGSRPQDAREDPQGLRRSADGLTDAQAADWPRASAFPPKLGRPQAVDTLKKLYTCYMETDASLAEINPLILEGNGNIKALDAKFNFDDNALYRQPEIVAYARPRRRRRRRNRGLQVRPRLHLARRQHRLPGERRRPGHGDDGHDQAVRRRAGQLPRRRRRRDDREGHRSLQDHAQEPQGQGHPGQHLRRHHEVRHHRHRRRRRGRKPTSPCRWSCA
jgi:hypothetical protein